VNSELPVFSCYYCHKGTGNPHTSLDRRIVRRITAQPGEMPRITIHVTDDQQLFTYCDMACWHEHESVVRAQLKLKSTYPQNSGTVPCSRCGLPVHRELPHVVYTASTQRLRDSAEEYIGEILEEHDFAVLCPECEGPELAQHAARSAEAASQP
jgi:hypothetical protein